jgi:2-succinyl-6-hydroxy-2,4-cyclohexadiene-1-carboxylate synthase
VRRTPLVLLHGFTGAPASYDATRRHLRTYDRDLVHVPLLMGHGPAAAVRAQQPCDASPFEVEVRLLGDQLHALGVAQDNPAILVGYSLGARLALGLLVTRPELFRHGVLIGVNPGLQTEAARVARRHEDEHHAALLSNQGLEAFLSMWQAQPLFDTQSALPDSSRAQQDATRRAHTAEGLARSLRRTGLAEMPNYTPQLGELTTPLHLVVGERDLKFRQIAERMAAVMPAAKLAVVPGVGHNVPLEAPQALAALLDALPKERCP